MHPWDVDPDHPGLTVPEVEAYETAANDIAEARRKAARRR